MKKTNINSKKGFTIIEVVLVLAIAGLIFLMVFIALPALQRNQRDTQRRNDYSMLSSAITSYASNNGGKIDRLSTQSACNKSKALDAKVFINQEGKDPDGVDYTLVACTASQFLNADHSEPAAGEVYVVIGADCTGSAPKTSNAYPKANNSTRAFAIYGYVENGTSYCSASQ